MVNGLKTDGIIFFLIQSITKQQDQWNIDFPNTWILSFKLDMLDSSF